MAETTSILTIDLTGPVKSIKELRQQIEGLSVAMASGTLDAEQMAKAEAVLADKQAQLTKATSLTKGQVDGVKGSYYALNKELAETKKAYKNLSAEERDATEEGIKMRNQIKSLSDQLKEIDAGLGDYHRNVGDYTNSIKAAFEGAHLASTKLGMGIKNIDTSLKLFGKNKVIAIISLLLPLITKIVDKLKENQTVIDSLKRALKSLEPILDVCEKAIETIATWVSKAVDYFVQMAGESGETFRKIIVGAAGVGDVMVNAMLTPLRTLIAGFKGLGNIMKDVFTGDFKAIKQDATDAFEGLKDAFVKGFSFKGNFEKGRRIGEEFAAGLGSSKKAVKGAAHELAEAVDEELSNLPDTEAALKKAEEYVKRRAELNAQLARDVADTTKEMEAEIASDIESTQAELLAGMEAYTSAFLAAEEKKKAAMEGGYAATLSIANSIADIYEAGSEANAENARRAKSIKIATATMETLEGAIVAYVQGMKAGGIPLALANSAAVTAAGLANIAKIRATDVSGKSDGYVEVSAPTAQQTPAVQPPTVEGARTGADEEDRINQRPVFAYLVASEAEAYQKAASQRRDEASW